MLFLGLVFSASLDLFGLSAGKYIKTYFNLLDSNTGKAIYIIFMSLCLMEFTQRGEGYIGAIIIIIALFDFMVGHDE
jgi:hypothetical protein